MLNVYGPTEATVNSTAAVCEAGEKDRQQTVPLFVAEALDVNGLHYEGWPPRLGASADRLFIGGMARKRDSRDGTVVM